MNCSFFPHAFPFVCRDLWFLAGYLATQNKLYTYQSWDCVSKFWPTLCKCKYHVAA